MLRGDWFDHTQLHHIDWIRLVRDSFRWPSDEPQEDRIDVLLGKCGRE